MDNITCILDTSANNRDINWKTKQKKGGIDNIDIISQGLHHRRHDYGTDALPPLLAASVSLHLFTGPPTRNAGWMMMMMRCW